MSLLGPEFRIFKNGYKVNRRIFQNILFFCWLYLIIAGFQMDWNFTPRAYFKCDDVMGCENPFYGQTNFLHKCYGQDWCSKQFLVMGTYGQRPPISVSFFPFYVIILTLIAVIGNHMIYNRGFKFETDDHSQD